MGNLCCYKKKYKLLCDEMIEKENIMHHLEKRISTLETVIFRSSTLRNKLSILESEQEAMKEYYDNSIKSIIEEMNSHFSMDKKDIKKLTERYFSEKEKWEFELIQKYIEYMNINKFNILVKANIDNICKDMNINKESVYKYCYICFSINSIILKNFIENKKINCIRK